MCVYNADMQVFFHFWPSWNISEWCRSGTDSLDEKAIKLSKDAASKFAKIHSVVQFSVTVKSVNFDASSTEKPEEYFRKAQWTVKFPFFYFFHKWKWFSTFKYYSLIYLMPFILRIEHFHLYFPQIFSISISQYIQ